MKDREFKDDFIQYCAKKKTLCKKMSLANLLKFFNKNFENHLFINNKIYLCINDANQSTASSELFKFFRKSETADCLLKWVTRHNAEPSQCITKFMTDDRQYS